MSPGLELIRAAAGHQSALANLLELYIHDFSELVPIDVGDDGRYGYQSLPLYFSDPARLPFLAKLDGKLIGFALVIRIPQPAREIDSWDMAEFFVLRRYRRRGIATQLAEKVWLLCPGQWQIRVMDKNVPARKFWESAIARFTAQPPHSSSFVKDGVAWHRYSLDSPR